MLHEVALPASGFALRYRNSVYGSLAEERFEITAEGRIRLRGLAAEDPAVLDEYYVLAGPPRRSPDGDDALGWVGTPARPVEVEELPLAASERGERTLLVEGVRPIALWRLAARTGPTVVLSVIEP